MIKPKNAGINTKKFKYQVTRWESLEDLIEMYFRFTYTTLGDDFNMDPFYGIDYIIKFNHLTRKYAAFVMDRRQPEKIAEIADREQRQGIDYVMHLFRRVVR